MIKCSHDTEPLPKNLGPRPGFSRIFGPVPSRRLGRSLGVDLVPAKTCTYDCIYCESGPTTHLTVERFSPFSPEKIGEELERYLVNTTPMPDIITLSGAGEPCLHAGMGEIIRLIRDFTSLPVAVLTNGSLLGREDVRKELTAADLILPSLDAATIGTFRRLNRPHPALNLEKIIAGLLKFRDQFPGRIWLEILLVRGVNDQDPELEALRAVVERLKPERVQLNTVDRPPSAAGVQPVSSERLTEVAALFGRSAEVIGSFRHQIPTSDLPDLADSIVRMLRRRPCTEEQIASALGAGSEEVSKVLEALLQEGRVGRNVYHGLCFYTS